MNQFLVPHGDQHAVYNTMTEARLMHPDATVYEVSRDRVNAHVGSPVWGNHQVHQAHDPDTGPFQPNKAAARGVLKSWQASDQPATYEMSNSRQGPGARPGARPLGPGGSR